MREDLAANVALEADIGYRVLQRRKMFIDPDEMHRKLELTELMGLLITICPFCPPSWSGFTSVYDWPYEVVNGWIAYWILLLSSICAKLTVFPTP